MSEFFHIMTLPFFTCLILAGMYAYLGFHVIERQVIFVDLALAQIAILGASFALVLGYDMESPTSYWLSLGFAIVGAAIFSLTRFLPDRQAGYYLIFSQRVQLVQSQNRYKQNQCPCTAD